jgi:peptide/nickel transport system substrate-binding protein
MRKLRWQLILVGLALAAIAILLLARQPLLRGLGAEPGQGGTYIEGLVGTIGRLNPLLDDANPADQDIDRLIFSGLLRYDERGNPQPDLAEAWGVSITGETYNITLRPNLTWHDGAALTTQDVAFTIDLMRNTELPIAADLRALWAKVEVIVLDERNMQFILPSAFAPFTDYLSFGVLPQHILGNLSPTELLNAPYNLQPVGSGPFRFEELLSEDGQIAGVSLRAWDGYYARRPFLDQVIFNLYDSSEDAYAAYQRGDVMGVSYLSPQVLNEALNDPNISIYSSRLPRLTLLLFNLGSNEVPFFEEQAVRKAIFAGINRQWIVDQFLGGQAFLAEGPILPGTWAYNENLPRIAYDRDAALTELRQAGYSIPASGGEIRSKDGISLSFQLVYPDTPLHAQIAASIQSDLAALGMDVRLLAVPYADLISNYLEPRTYQAALVDLNLSSYPDPDPYPFWHQAAISGGQNYARWDDRRASEYLEEARVSVDTLKRIRLYRNFQNHFINEVPAVPLYFPVYSYGVSPLVRGVSMGPLFQTSDRFATLSEWFLVARSQLDELEPTAQPQQPDSETPASDSPQQ